MMRICGSPAGSTVAGPCCSRAATLTGMSVSFLTVSPPAMLVATMGSPSAVAVGAVSTSSSAVGTGVTSGAGEAALSAAAASGVGETATGGAPSSMRTDASSSCSGSNQRCSRSLSGAPPAAADAICKPNTARPTQANFCRSVISAHLQTHSPQYIWFLDWNYVTASAIL